ncbi:hypothetical protein CCACVL1_25026 [Corchorus capsularis]|uniref:Uncharacterized protein n=1 Tax=Corchorus capsularis TaxID=210143 RepID=A0A1R3GM33_COCAP|nr:hypothetical protein CCACVL1_25026 [Corchorus capsularis]
MVANRQILSSAKLKIHARGVARPRPIHPSSVQEVSSALRTEGPAFSDLGLATALIKT